MKTKRKREIINAMPSFSKERYSKSELLPELLQLQAELVNQAFNGEHAENAQLKTWDVVKHLTALNEDRNHVADELLQKFVDNCKIVNESIRGEISGNKGENKAQYSIDTIRSKHTVLRNIELSAGDHRTEIDFIVFTAKAIFIIEVKNTARDIVIDEHGNYCRIVNGNTVFDKNIAEKMNDKAFLLRNILHSAGIEAPNIVSLVVFTNNCINVTNNFPFIHHCFLSSLPHLIDNYQGESIYDDTVISHMVTNVESANHTDVYELPLDVNQFKQDFADLMITLEGVSGDVQKVALPTISKQDVVAINATPRWLKGAAIVLGAVPIVGFATLATLKMVSASRR